MAGFPFCDFNIVDICGDDLMETHLDHHTGRCWCGTNQIQPWASSNLCASNTTKYLSMIKLIWNITQCWNKNVWITLMSSLWPILQTLKFAVKYREHYVDEFLAAIQHKSKLLFPTCHTVLLLHGRFQDNQSINQSIRNVTSWSIKMH